MSRQLNNANEELRDLRTEFGKVTSYNEALIRQNESLRDELGRGRRRRRDEETVEDRRGKRTRHSSDDESDEEGPYNNDAARVRLKSLLLILIEITLILTDF